ncbi:HNH endonuclease signature motif containing protein [Salipiger sp.]|uniref:HNH endonuclease signature motif containing protein n=1 Tax=Salipiger sp. TaxID=2078585 RepID=UPI003A97FFD4
MCLSGQTVAVHRVMFTHHFGYIPGRKQIDHRCRNRMCVNPAHLEMVTHKTNQRRRDEAARGDPNGP